MYARVSKIKKLYYRRGISGFQLLDQPIKLESAEYSAKPQANSGQFGKHLFPSLAGVADIPTSASSRKKRTVHQPWSALFQSISILTQSRTRVKHIIEGGCLQHRFRDAADAPAE